jgi:hypothetical protein
MTTITITAAGLERAEQLLPRVRAGAGDPSIGVEYVLAGALRIGLGAIESPGGEALLALPAELTEAQLEVAASDEQRAEVIAERTSTPLPRVLSAAVLAGLAVMTGDPSIRGIAAKVG